MKIVYLCDIDQDIDDLIAVEYLYQLGFLDSVVLDPYPISADGLARLDYLKNDLKIEICEEIKSNSEYIFVGGAFTKLAKYLKINKVKLIVANGGFVGSNIVPKHDQLKKFANKGFVRTYNFNLDVNSVCEIIKSDNYEKMLLIGKNVCHNSRNTYENLWQNNIVVKKYVDNHNLRINKLLHDLLMCKVGIDFIEFGSSDLLTFLNIEPVNQGLNGNMTKWGSEVSQSSKILAAINWK